MANVAVNDLTKTPYKITYNDYDLHFSTPFHKKKFICNVEDYVKNETLKLINRYKVNIELKDYFVLSYYIKCESRGFYVIKNGIEIKPELKCYLL